MSSNADPNSVNPQAGAGRPLPKKESDIFKNVVKQYEVKQYKKAIKQADIILKRFPNHGETLAMKGLTLNYMNKREEAHALVKEGLRNDMRSHVCWHVYGLLHRSDHDYNEAIKAYKQALKVDPQNLQILRDLSMLQIQMRDLEGFAVTRNTLLTLKPNAKINWMAFALARHISGDLLGAVNVIDIYLGTLTEGSSELGRCFESSELAMYKNSILAEIPNNFKEALDHLGVCEAITVDRGAWLRKRAEYQLKLKDFVAATQSIYLMFDRGMTEDYAIHSLYMCILLQLDDEICDEALQLKGTQAVTTMMPLSDEQKSVVIDAYENTLSKKYPKSAAVQRIPSSLMNDTLFRQAIEVRCRKDLQRGVPSLCSELHAHLWSLKNGRYVRTADPVDVKSHHRYKLFVDVIDGYIISLETLSKFSTGDNSEEDPTVLFWAWFLRAGLHELAGEYIEGLSFVEKCIKHTPTAVDAHELKALLLKRSGDIEAAAECLDHGRELDRQDRYINNQTTKYLLQAGKEDEALQRISLFTRHEGNAEQNLYDMQCSWYELELASCLAKKGKLGPSLKKYAAVVKHFDDFQEDQFDFHSYCLRKVTLRAYISVLRFEDVIYGQDFFSSAATGIVSIYLQLFDVPSNNESEEPDYSTMDAAERKKAKAIARKKKKATEKKETDSKANAEEPVSQNGNQKASEKSKLAAVDEDPLGLEFLKKDPLQEAKKYASMLVKYAPKIVNTWILQYEVAMRLKKPMLALQALFKARSLDSDSTDLFVRIIDFSSNATGSTFNDSPAAVGTVIAELTPVLLGHQSVESFILCAQDKILADPSIELPMRMAVAKAMVEKNMQKIQDAMKLITDGGIDARKVSVETCLSTQHFLESLGSDALDATVLWKDAVRKRFPMAIQPSSYINST